MFIVNFGFFNSTFIVAILPNEYTSIILLIKCEQVYFVPHIINFANIFYCYAFPLCFNVIIWAARYYASEAASVVEAVTFLHFGYWFIFLISLQAVSLLWHSRPFANSNRKQIFRNTAKKRSQRLKI